MKKILLIGFGITAILGILFGLFFYQGIYIGKDSQGEEEIFTVERGERLSQIAKNLEKKEVIKRDYFFIFYVAFHGKEKDLKAGNYLLSASMNIPEIAEKIFLGDKSGITIIEGWNLNDIAIYLEEKRFGSEKEFYDLVGTPPSFDHGVLEEEKKGSFKRDRDFLEELSEDISFEGYLFPDTYYISPGTSLEDVVDIMISNFERRVVKGMEEEIRESGKSLFEIITIASLVEKEVTDFEEKRLVAGIIEERRRRGMRLQIDATITYLTKGRSVVIPTTETKIDSPYNTYAYAGLPKGPICNPSRESIRAVLSPKDSSYLYYLSKPNGETVFSRNHDEHIEAKNKYLR